MPDPTPQQRAAIAASGNVLVMAGAGTGKTSTLVARVADRLCRAEGRVPADRLLMVTFTEAAAREMRSRLRAALEDRAAAAPDDDGLRAQRARLELAQIGTLHAFCLRLLREHGALLGLDPRFAVLDEVEGSRMAAAALDAVIDPPLSGAGDGAAAVRALARGLFRGDLGALRDAVRRVHGHARTLADPAAWLAAEEARWASGEPHAWSEALADAVPAWAARWRARLAAIADNPNASRRADALGAWLDAGATGDGVGALLDALVEAGDEAWPPRRKGACKAPLEPLFAEAGFLRSLVPRGAGPDPLSEDWAWCRGGMAALVSLARAFGERFASEKRARALLDFQDLEQGALDLLVRGDGSVAAACRERFDLVVVDECQDVNAAQDAVVRAVSRDGDGANRFLVGDVKQSIYRFRLADPRVFQALADAWSRPGAEGRVLPLTGNFRSAEGILRHVNAVFPRLMRREVGGVEYGPDAALAFGDPTGRAPLASSADPAPRVEIHVLETGRDEPSGGGGGGEGSDDADTATGAAEARVVAARFRALHDAAEPVWDRALGAMRPVRWSDMAVLLRAEKDRAAEYAAEFAAAGIPLQARRNGFFAQPEVSDLACVLRCLDNPLQDIPLVAVLRSPLVGLDDLNGLAVIRMFRRDARNWWPLVQAFADAGTRLGLRTDDPAAGPAAGPDTPLVDDPGAPALSGDAVFVHPATAPHAAAAWRRVARLLRWYPGWRLRAERRGMAAALEAVLDDTGCEARLEARAEDAGALANVRRLLALARDFDAGQRGGLYRFVQWIAALEDADRIEASTGAGGDAVQLMTVHRSKGLEFPVVAVGGLGRKFNLGDLTRSEVVIDDALGLCPVVVAPDERRYPSAALWLAQRRQTAEALGEELRLLYVALTRAADRLVLVGTPSRKALEERWPAAAASAGTGPLPVHAVEDARCALDWLGPLVVADAGPAWDAADAGTADTFSWRRWRELPAVPAQPAADAIATTPDAAPAPAVPATAATTEPAKVTVTGLRKRVDAAGDGESAPWMRWAGPKASEPDDVGAVERGVLHHRFLEHADFARLDGDGGVASEVARLKSERRFTDAESAALDVAALARFAASDLGRRARAAGAGLRREFPFTLRLDTADLRELGVPSAAGLPDDEFVVAQGVVDALVPEGDGVWILDYKTDRVAPGREADKAAGYRVQLRVYAWAVERILGRRVLGCWLHFLATGASVQVI